MRYLGIVFLILLFSTLSICKAQDPDQEDKPDSEYVESLSYKFSFHPSYTNQSTIFQLNNRGDSDNSLLYRPNVLGAVTLAARYKFIALSYSIPIPYSNQSTHVYGQTDYKNIGISINVRTYSFNLYFLRYKGFYVDQDKQYFPTFNASKPLPQRPDMQIYTVGFLHYFVFSKNLSLKAAFDQSEIQKKSKGAFVLMLADRFTKMTADSSIVPFDDRFEFPKVYGLTKGLFNSFIIAPGAAGTLVKGKFTYTPMVLCGIGLQYQYYNLVGNIWTRSRNINMKFPLYLNFRSALGYNSRNFFTRLVLDVDLNRIPFRKSSVSQLTYISARVCAGFRF